MQVARTFSYLSKPTDTPRQDHLLMGTGPEFMVSGQWARLNLGMEATPFLSATQTKACPQNTFCFHTDEDNISLDYPSAVRNQGLPLRALEMNPMVIFWHNPELWGSITYFSTLLSGQSTTSSVASLYLQDGKTISPFFADKDLLSNITRLGN